MGIEFYLIHSIKGGCGKTSVSLMLAAQLAANGRKTCVLDMDFKGTGLSHLLFGGDDAKSTGGVVEKPEGFQYWNGCFTDPTTRFNEHMLAKICANTMPAGKEFGFEIAVSNPKQAERDKFISNTSPTDGLAVNIALFRYKFIGVIQILESMGYSAVVLDLPPSFDEYTKGIFFEFFSKENDSTAVLRGKETHVGLYLVTSYDVAHIYATQEFLANYFKRSRHRYREADQVRVVLNDVTHVGTLVEPGAVQNFVDLFFKEQNLHKTKNTENWLVEIPWNQQLTEATSILSEKAQKSNIMELIASDCVKAIKDAVTSVPNYLLAKWENKKD